jgi:hypothetical protein
MLYSTLAEIKISILQYITVTVGSHFIFILHSPIVLQSADYLRRVSTVPFARLPLLICLLGMAPQLAV